MTAQLEGILRDGLASALAEPELSRVVAACAVHFALVSKWNPTHNLTRVVAAADAAVLHYLDCALPLLAWARETAKSPETPTAFLDSFLDIGSGAGFPGLVAAVLWPSAQAVLVEPAQKRQSFLRVAAGELGLSRVQVIDPKAAQKQRLTAPLVLSRATFSDGGRGELWGYVAAGGSLLAWTTTSDLSTWETEAKTWPSAHGTWNPYELAAPKSAETAASASTTFPAAPSPASKASAPASPEPSAGQRRHGIFEVRRG